MYKTKIMIIISMTKKNFATIIWMFNNIIINNSYNL